MARPVAGSRRKSRIPKRTLIGVGARGGIEFVEVRLFRRPEAAVLDGDAELDRLLLVAGELDGGGFARAGLLAARDRVDFGADAGLGRLARVSDDGLDADRLRRDFGDRLDADDVGRAREDRARRESKMPGM